MTHSRLFRQFLLALAPAVCLALAGCAAPASEQSAMSAYRKGTPGGLIARTIRTSATVTGIDAITRKVTLVGRDGKEFTIKAGPEVVNFNEIQVGDQVHAVFTEQLVISLKGKDEPVTADGHAGVIVLAPVGAKPGGVLAETVQVTAKVVGIDLQNQQATLQFPDGTTQKVAVREDVDLRQRKLGEEVILRSTESVAVLVERQTTNRK